MSKLSLRQREAAFIRKARTQHGDKYDYSRLGYVNADTKVRIGCPAHGDFMQVPYSHLKGRDCPVCGAAKRTKSENAARTFVEKATSVHGTAYSYAGAEYRDAKTPVQITCNEHGPFYQQPQHHLAGSGCPKCGAYGFQESEDAYLYVLLSECGAHVKVGICRDPQQRFDQLRRATPFAFVVLEKYPLSGKYARLIEKWAHSVSRSSNFEGFNGATEWLLYAPDIEYQLHCTAKQAARAA